MSSHPSPQIVAPVIKLGRRPDASFVKQIAQRFEAAGGATWVASDNRQIAALPSAALESPRNAVGLALEPAGDGFLLQQLRDLNERGIELAAIHAAGGLSSQALSAMHVCRVPAVVVEATPYGAARRLPVGIWQLAVSGTTPESSRWRRLRGKTAARQLDTHHGAAVVQVDLTRAAAGRGWRAVEQFLTQLLETHRERYRTASVAELVAELDGQCSARPQRSILRAA